jgi:hypothetical protein
MINRIRIMYLALVLAAVAGMHACDKEGPITANAVVAGEGPGCGWLVKFFEAPGTLPSSKDNTYIVVNLAEMYQYADLEIYLEGQEAQGEDILTCGPGAEAYIQVVATKVI